MEKESNNQENLQGNEVDSSVSKDVISPDKEFKSSKVRLTEDYRGIFDTIEDAITHYLFQKDLDEMFLSEFGISVFELSLYIEEYLITHKANLQEIYENVSNM